LKLSRLRRVLEESVPGFPSPRRELEQYRTPPEAALEAVSLLPAGCRLVVDLGAGTGMIAYAASLSRGWYVVAVDVDDAAVEAARGSSLYPVSLVDFVVADASRLPLRSGAPGLCVAQNPPFGVVRRGADRLFVEAASRLGAAVVVSMHLFSRRAEVFLRRLYGRLGYRVDYMAVLRFPIPQLYPRHAKRIHYASVVLVLARRVEQP